MMAKILFFTMFLAVAICSYSFAQKRYGYTILYLRCGKEEPHKNRVYYSPVIELNRLNFNAYTGGVDPAFPLYSVRYYNYAIARWFEIYLKEHFRITVNDPEKYERDATSVVFDNKNNDECNDDKTDPGCFFTDKQKLILKRNNAIRETRMRMAENNICEVISL